MSTEARQLIDSGRCLELPLTRCPDCGLPIPERAEPCGGR